MEVGGVRERERQREAKRGVGRQRAATFPNSPNNAFRLYSISISNSNTFSSIIYVAESILHYNTITFPSPLIIHNTILIIVMSCSFEDR